MAETQRLGGRRSTQVVGVGGLLPLSYRFVSGSHKLAVWSSRRSITH
jgi:hypothetical protein